MTITVMQYLLVFGAFVAIFWRRNFPGLVPGVASLAILVAAIIAPLGIENDDQIVVRLLLLLQGAVVFAWLVSEYRGAVARREIRFFWHRMARTDPLVCLALAVQGLLYQLIPAPWGATDDQGVWEVIVVLAALSSLIAFYHQARWEERNTDVLPPFADFYPDASREGNCHEH